MGYIKVTDIKKEFLNFIRSSNVLSTSTRGVTTYTDTFTASTSPELFTLTKSGIRNVRSIKVNTVQVYDNFDLIWNSTTGYITGVTISNINIGDTIDISYDYKSTSGSSIYGDYPRQDWTISSYPRIGIDVISFNSSNAGMGNVNVSDLDILIKVLDTSVSNCDSYIDILREAFIDSQTQFQTVSFVKVKSTDPVVPVSIRGKNKVFSKSMRLTMINNYEIN